MSKYAEELLAEGQQTEVLSANYKKAVSLHRRICVSAELAEQNLFEMCKGLCEMRDYKLYRELGYKNFEDYCTQELKITRRQGQKYAAIASLLNIENGKSTSHLEKLGTEKLYLLSRIEEDARIEIMGKTDLESTSVRELKYKIAELEKNKAKLISDLESACADRDQERDWREELAMENGKQSDRISELIAQVDELESRPVEVVAKPDEEIVKAHLREIDSLQRQHKEELDEQREKYQKQMREGIAKAKKLAQAPDIGELWRALDAALDNAIEAIEDFFDDYEDHPKIKDYANSLKRTARDLNTTVNNVLVGGSE
ncbi:MAG: hypothetical protein IJ071_06685 [Ruminococcus sp.]|nr:hypothetical protein [Ruminococcus sp.]